MKKVILTTVTILLVNLLNAQWVQSEFVDEFGDKTGKKYEYIISDNGNFSNSATTGSKLTCKFIHSKKLSYIVVDVYEYGSSLANEIEATFETVKIKQPSGNIVVINKVFFTKNGSLFFSKEKYQKLISSIKEKGKYKMVWKRTGNYSDSNYLINFKI